MLCLKLYLYPAKFICIEPLGFILFLILFFSLFPKNTIGQTEGSFEGSVLKIKAVNPSDISAVLNPNGGIYFFWKEGRATIESKVFYAYVDLTKKTSQNILGTNISHLSIVQNYPKSSSYISTDAILAWKDYTNQPTGDLYLQRISKNELLWNRPGIKANNSPGHIFDYNISTDKSGNIFLAYLSRSEYPSNNFEINYQRILSDGSLAYSKEAILVESSSRLKSNLKVIQDNNGGAYVLWTEKLNDKESLLIKRIDPSGKMVFGKRPIKISGTLHSVKSFSAAMINNNLLYIAWESSDKNIYHQLINSLGKALWPVGGVKAVFTKGANFSPTVIQSDNVITLGWVNSFYKRYSICMQKFKNNGKEIWPNKGIFAATIDNAFEKFSITKNADGSYYVIFLYPSRENDFCNIGIQKVNSKGIAVWDSMNHLGSFSPNCSNKFLNTFVLDKNLSFFSYQNMNGEIVVEPIKELVKAESDSLNLSAQSYGKYVKLLLNTDIKDEKLSIMFERQLHSDTSQNIWESVGKIEVYPQSAVSEYQYIDNPTEFGTLYYRALLKNRQKEVVSNIVRIDFLEAASKIVVAQNNPNPFRDSTVINFYLPASSFVGFEFFNEQAEKVREIPEKEFPAGENSVVFYRNGLKPGIYFYKFYTKEFVEVKKMVIN